MSGTHPITSQTKWQLGAIAFRGQYMAVLLFSVELGSRLGGGQIVRLANIIERLTTTRLTLTGNPLTETVRLHLEASSTLTEKVKKCQKYKNRKTYPY